MADKLILKTWFEMAPHLEALVDGRVTSERIVLDRVNYPFPKAVRALVRDEEFDVSEVPLTTLALARAYRDTYIGLPVVVSRDFHQRSIVVRKDAPFHGPADLAGKRIGVRAYSVTTGVWVRGILQEEFGVDPAKVTWVTTEDAHVSEYSEPSNVERAPAGADLLDLLLKGEIDAAIGLRNHDFSKVRYLFDDVDKATAEWHRKTGVYPVNHIMSVRCTLAAAHPWLSAEIFRMFEEAKQLAMQAGWQAQPTFIDGTARETLLAMVGPDLMPNGLIPNRPAFSMLLEMAHHQGLTPRLFGIDDVIATPGSPASN
ncbi:ABC transporter substrate-binding protein [Devosia beringensis]|uniref:ABC transporter substrate-binding protein n=1 Tax=Devosia beringensis TaxID=2657486 RepID=UPI00186B9278|nr:ABC transporter substrate-binding protein [Devosia beringensis]